MKKHRWLIVVCMFALFFIFIGCSEKAENTTTQTPNQEESTNRSKFQNHIPSTANRDNLPFTKGGSGVALGLYNPNGQIETKYHFQVNKNESIKKFISIGNLVKKDRVYKILLFVDYQQATFSVDGNKPMLDYDVKMKAGQTIEIPVEVAPLSEGLHDILFVIVKYPDKKLLDEEFRKQTDLNHLLFQRFSVNVGNKQPAVRNIQFDNLGEFKNENLGGVFVSKDNNYRRWLTQDVGLNKKLNYYIHVGNTPRKENQKFALIVLFDWKQVNITDQKNVLFYNMKKNNSFDLKTHLLVPDRKGVYDLTALLISNPYQKLDMYNRETEASIRIGINAKDY